MVSHWLPRNAPICSDLQRTNRERGLEDLGPKSQRRKEMRYRLAAYCIAMRRFAPIPWPCVRSIPDRTRTCNLRLRRRKGESPKPKVRQRLTARPTRRGADSGAVQFAPQKQPDRGDNLGDGPDGTTVRPTWPHVGPCGEVSAFGDGEYHAWNRRPRWPRVRPAIAASSAGNSPGWDCARTRSSPASATRQSPAWLSSR